VNTPAPTPAARRPAAATWAVLAACSIAPAHAAREPLPYHLALSIDYGGAQGSASWRREIELALLDRLSRNSCFASVSRFDPGDSRDDVLELRLTVLAFSERTTWDVSMATLNAPDAPPETGQQRVVELRAELDLELRTVPDQASVRRRELAFSVAHRPMIGEEPRLAARLALVEDAARTIGAWTCKGSAKKLAQAIAKARQDAARDDGAH